MLYILTPEGALSFILYRISLFQKSQINFERQCQESLLFVAVFLGCIRTGRVGFMVFVVLCQGTPEGSTGSGSGFKASQKTNNGLKSHPTYWEKPRI